MRHKADTSWPPPFGLWLKSRFIRTPLQAPLECLAFTAKLKKWIKHPEIRGVLREHADIKRLISRVLSPESNCIDVGAHLGSVLAAFCKVAPQGRHAAIEAVPYKADWLKRRFPDVDVHATAAADRSGEVEFFENVTSPGFSSIGQSGKANETVISYTVSCSSLDAIIPSARRISLMKVDVEGAELLVLRGARRIIAESRPIIIFESGPGSARHHGLKDRDLYELLDASGYQIFVPRDFVCGRNPLTCNEFERCHVYPFRAFNFIAVYR